MENRITFSKCVEGKSRFLLALFLLCFCSFTWAQVKVVGIVTDSSGEAIIGANIVEKGVPGNGTISDINGNFTLNVKSNKAVLTVSFIGYKDKNVSLNGSTSLKVTLEEDSQALDEVVVVGYGSVKKSNLTTSVSKMTSEAIEGRPVTNLSDALSGQLAGVQTQTGSGIPGEEMQITVRGVSSINGSSSPLIVVDGVITENMSNVNPSDVASIQVLKDAAATSIYGARGSAGVILIETKQAQKGAPVVKWESYLGFQNAVGLPEMMSPEEWMAYNLWLKNAMWLQKDGNNTLDTPNKSRPSGDRVNPDWLLNPNSDTADWTLRSDLPQTDWVDAILRTAFTHSHQVSVSSKGDRYSIYASAGYMNQEGIVKHTGYERFNFRINASMNINKHIKAGVNFAPTISSQDRGESEGKDKVIMTALTMIPTIDINEGTRSLGFSKFRKDDVNPYERLKQVTDRRSTKNFDVASWVEANIIKGLTFKSMFNYSSDNRIDEYFLPLDVQKMSVKSATASSKVISGSRTGWQNTLSYDLAIKKKHQMNILLGQSIENRSIYTADMKATDFPLDNVYTLNQGATPSLASTVRNIVRTASLFGRLSYNYGDKYLLSASVRRDGSSRFGTKGRWATFWSVGLMWNILGEKFMKNCQWLTNAQLAVSTGTSGNSEIPNYDHLALVAGSGDYMNEAGIAPISKGNENLEWEKLWTTNIALHLGFFNRINLNAEFYNKKTTNMLMAVPVSYADAGYGSRWDNVGGMLNRGVELDINADIIQTKDWNWNVSANVSYNKNEITELYNGVQEYTIATTGTKLVVGHSYGEFYLNRYAGVNPANGDPLWYDKNGEITTEYNEADKVLVGHSYIAPWQGGFGTTVSWKGLSLGAQFSWVGDRWMINNDRYFEENTTFDNYNLSRRMLYDRWKKPGDVTDIPRYGTTPQFDTHLLENASFLRLKNLTLGYTFPEALLKKTKFFSKGRIYAQAQNLFTFTDFSGLDPESHLNMYQAQYPMSRQFTFGLEVTF